MPREAARFQLRAFDTCFNSGEEALTSISCAGFLSTCRPPRLPLRLTRGLFSFLLGRTKKGTSGSLGSPLNPVHSAQARCLPRNLPSISKTDSPLWQDNRKESGDGSPIGFLGILPGLRYTVAPRGTKV